MIDAGAAAPSILLERERTRLVGPRYAHLPVRDAYPAIADAASRFRRVIGAREGMAALVRALERYDRSKSSVESTRKVA